MSGKISLASSFSGLHAACKHQHILMAERLKVLEIFFPNLEDKYLLYISLDFHRVASRRRVGWKIPQAAF